MWNETQRVARASTQDDELDEDKNGIADVDELTPQQLAQRKLLVRLCRFGQRPSDELLVERLLQRGCVRLLPHAHPADPIESRSNLAVPHERRGRCRLACQTGRSAR